MISSTSRNFRRPDITWPGRRHWIVGVGAGLLIAAMLVWHQQSAPAIPELRVAATNRAISGEIIDGERRVLILNAAGPQDARSVIGALGRPWESRPSTIIVGADRAIEEALWESIHRVKPRQIIVAGAPGDEPEWAAIERHCRDSGIEITYLSAETIIDMDELRIRITPPVDDGTSSEGSYVTVSRDGILIGLGLGGTPAGERYHVAIAERALDHTVRSDLIIALVSDEPPAGERTMDMRPGERIDLRIGPERITVHGSAANEYASD